MVWNALTEETASAVTGNFCQHWKPAFSVSHTLTLSSELLCL